MCSEHRLELTRERDGGFKTNYSPKKAEALGTELSLSLKDFPILLNTKAYFQTNQPTNQPQPTTTNQPTN